MKSLHRNLHAVLLLLLISGMVSVVCSCSDSSSADSPTYDPSKPITLTSFYPDSGYYQQKVLLHGSNFGNDPKAVRVYFNKKQAAVIGAAGDILYVNAARLPGDTCQLSVVIGGDSVTYPSTFRYFQTVTVSTICGNGTLDDPIQGGTLSESVLNPRYLCVDKDGNVFASCWSATYDDPHLYAGCFGVVRVNEVEDIVDVVYKSTTTGMEPNVPCADPTTGVVTLPVQATPGSYISLDPKEYWSPRQKNMVWPEGYDVPERGWKHCMVVNPSDGCIYTRFYYGNVIKINPNTGDVTPICKTASGDSYGLTFNPKYPNILFITMYDNGGSFANSLCCIDLNSSSPQLVRLSSVNTAGGHRDGRLSVSQFRQPCQIYCDDDGNMYIADRGNDCIRRVTPDGMVETALGIPGTAGWKDGGKAEALFNQPTGIGVSKDGSVYVADFGNGRIRKMTIN